MLQFYTHLKQEKTKSQGEKKGNIGWKQVVISPKWSDYGDNVITNFF